MDAKPQRRPRADGQRNRERLLQAAMELVAEHGADVSVAQIVAAADVGPPTLYRHFGSKEALIEEALALRFATLEAQVELALESPDGWTGLLSMTRWHLGLAMTDRYVRERPGELTPEVQEVLLQTWTTLIERGQCDGSVREDIAATDVLYLYAAVGGIAPFVDGRPALQQRYLALLLGSFRPGPPLPGCAPPVEIREAFTDHTLSSRKRPDPPIQVPTARQP